MAKELPTRRLHLSEVVKWHGQTWLMAVGFDADGLANEIFLDACDPIDATLQASVSRSAIAASKHLQDGVRLEEMARKGLTDEHPMAGLFVTAIACAARLEAECGAAIAEAYGAIAAQRMARDGMRFLSGI